MIPLNSNLNSANSACAVCTYVCRKKWNAKSLLRPDINDSSSLSCFHCTETLLKLLSGEIFRCSRHNQVMGFRRLQPTYQYRALITFHSLPLPHLPDRPSYIYSKLLLHLSPVSVEIREISKDLLLHELRWFSCGLRRLPTRTHSVNYWLASLWSISVP